MFAARIPGLAFGLALVVRPAGWQRLQGQRRGFRRAPACGDADSAARKIAITMELYTRVPDKATLAALKRLSDALGSADAALPHAAE